MEALGTWNLGKMQTPTSVGFSELVSIRATGKLLPIYMIDGQPIHVSTLEQTCKLILDSLDTERSFFVCTLNLDHLVKLRADEAFRRVYAEAAIVTADGFPIVLLAAMDHIYLSRVTGADIVLPLCRTAATNDLPVFLVGPTAATLDLSMRKLTRLIPDLRIVGAAVPPAAFDPQSEEANALIEQIKVSGAKICFIALGAPKQEIFSALASTRIQGAAFIPVGAALEFIAGTKRRAPEWLRLIGLEWTWRLLSEPRRLSRRYLASAMLFLDLLKSRFLWTDKRNSDNRS